MLSKGAYQPIKEEEKILDFWLKGKYFKPEYDREKGLLSTEEMKNDDRESFCIINPPPNAYMKPHIGNVSGYAYQDVFLRFNRLIGKKVLGQPGKDHAGIQGEVVVENIFIKNKGKSKKDMGREKFYLSAYDHFSKMMPQIMETEKRIGLSSDYDRNIFTLDPKIVKTVISTFEKMFKENMVYKGVRIVNWDVDAQTTLADIDTERVERESELVYIKYPFVKQKAWFLSFNNEIELDKIRDGVKTSEIRALNPDEEDRYFREIKIGDMVVCVNKTNEKVKHVYKIVKGVVEYENFDDAFEKIDWEKAGIENGEEMSKEEIVKYFEENINEEYVNKIKDNGFVLIELTDLEDSDFITIATTRAETMLADTAVVVNPTDVRYKDMVGKKVIIPLVNREVPIITSPRVEKDFGTGMVKLTPAHAYDDYIMMNEWNADHGEEITYINIINKKGKMSGPIPSKYLGLTTVDCREEVKKDLGDLIIKVEPHKQMVMIGERSKAVIEQIMSSQWFIDVDRLKMPAYEAVKSGKIKIHPQYMTKRYLNWIENLHDWPVSRSLWWGYRFPIWYFGGVEEVTNSEGKIIEKINGVEVKDIQDATAKGLVKMQMDSPGEGWVQDDNVFDTWFSSGQWPFATLRANDLIDTFYPTQVMETAYDILELWVSRMIMLSLYVENTIPFEHVYLHGLVKASDGQKMSKSKNNIVLPEDVINKYGADALRLFYIVGNKAGSGYPISYEKLEGYKRFLNKIWNASKFAFGFGVSDKDLKDIDEQDLMKEDIAQLEKVKKLSASVRKKIENFRIGLASDELYQEFWHDFCDKYIEEVKPRLYTKDKDGNPINQDEEAQKSQRSAKYTLMKSLKAYLILLHPFIPFITEVIWQELPNEMKECKTIMYAKWPD